MARLIRPTLLLLISISLWSCKEQQDQVEKFIFDHKQLSGRTTHQYEFDAEGKIVSDTYVTYMMMGGKPIDTAVSRELFTYSPTGKLQTSFDLIDSSRRIMHYDEFDSLSAEYTINNFGDTTLKRSIDFQNGLQKRVSLRYFMTKLPKNANDFSIESLRQYDTAYSIVEYFYKGSRLTKSHSREIDGRLISETEFFYDGDRRIKSLKYAFLDTIKFLSETTYWPAEDLRTSDYFTIGVQNDTVAFKKTIFQNNMKIVLSYSNEPSSQSILYYDDKNNLVGAIDIFLAEKIKYVRSY